MRGLSRLATSVVFFSLMLANAVLAKGPKLTDLTNNQWVKLLANTLMIATVVFLIYIYAVPDDKADNKRKIIIALLVLGLCALIAHQFMTEIWFWKTKLVDGIFHKKVLINIGAMAAGLFGLLVVAGAISSDLKTQLDKTAVKYAVILVILFVSFNSALGPFFPDVNYGEDRKMLTWDEIKTDYKYVWEKPDIQKITFYFFGDSKCTYEGRKYCYYTPGEDQDGKPNGYGVFRPPYILIFGLSLMLIIWAFKTFKFITDIDWLQWIIAILLSSVLAHRGTTIETFAFVAQVVSIFIIQKSIQGADKDMAKWVSWGVSFAIVGAITYYVFPEYALGWVSSLFGMGLWMALGILFGVGFLIGLAIKMFKKKDGEKSKTRLIQELGTLFRNWLKNTARRSRWSRGLTRMVEVVGGEMKIDSLDGQLNDVFNRLNIEFQALMNYMLRLEVFGGKYRTIVSHKQIAKDAITQMVKADVHTFDSAFKEMSHFKLGSGFKVTEEGTIELLGEPTLVRDNFGKRTSVSSKNIVPALTPHYYLYKTFAGIKSMVDSPGKGLINKTVYQHGDHYTATDIGDNEIQSAWDTEWLNSEKLATGLWTGEKSRIRRYGAVNIIYSQRMMILDQYRMTGEVANHTYTFAHPKAPFSKYTYGDINKDFKDRDNVGPNEPDAGTEIKTIDGEHMYEVSHDGFIIQDIAEAETIDNETLKNAAEIRRIHPSDFLWGNMLDIMEWQDIEWKAFLDDLRDGRYHPNSRTAKEYIDAIAKEDYSFQTLAKKGTPEWTRTRSTYRPDSDNPAYDMEALKDFGLFPYWGRREYWESVHTINRPPESPYPAVTTKGMSRYLRERVIQEAKDVQSAIQDMSRWVYDSGSAKDYFTKNIAEGKD